MARSAVARNAAATIVGLALLALVLYFVDVGASSKL